MALFKAFVLETEVNGETVLSLVNGASLWKSKMLENLGQCGIVDPQPGKWYSQQSWLNAFKIIAEKIGANTLYAIGKTIPENAKWPPNIDSLEKGLSLIDVAYHMNHRIKNEILFNPVTGQMKEGIGHYKFTKTGEKSGMFVCDNPYPCDFDRGIIESVANRFKPKGSFVSVKHDDSKPCRTKGGEACTYLITW